MKTIAQQLNIKEFPFEIKDKNNNKLYFENSYGYWIKREFDKNNNEVYYENSIGSWVKREYDENNNKLYYENSDGYWIRREFEGNKEVYYKNSKGTIRDNRKPTMTKKEAEKKFNIKIK